MRGILTINARLRPGDTVLNGSARTVARTMGVQGRKPANGAPLMRIVFDDGEILTVREDTPVRIRARSMSEGE